MGPLIAIVVGVSIVGAVVALVKRMLQRHEPTPEQIEQAQESESPGAQLPTATTEMTEPMPRDPEFEADAQPIRDRQGS